MRGVLGCSDDVSNAKGFLPVYFRGLGDVNLGAVLDAPPLLADPTPAALLFDVDAVNLGVLCTPVICVGESIVKLSSSCSWPCNSAPEAVSLSRSVGVSSAVVVVSVCVTSVSSSSSSAASS